MGLKITRVFLECSNRSMFNLIIELYRYRNFIKKIGVNRTKRRFRFGVSGVLVHADYKCIRVFIVKRLLLSVYTRLYYYGCMRAQKDAYLRV